MTVQIDTTAENNALRLVNQGAAPATPSVNHTLLYVVTGTNPGLYIKNDVGQQIGPFITGSPTGGRVLLSEVLPTGTSVTLSSSIPGTYKKLIIEFSIRSTQAATEVNGVLQFNADTTAGNYYYNQNRNSSFGSTNDSGASYNFAVSAVSAGNSLANGYAIGVIQIPQYANTGFFKTATYQLGMWDNTFSQAVTGALEWKSTSAITQIDMALSAGNFVAGSVIRLYGDT